MLLTPGVFFRLGDNSSAQMVLPGLTNTEVELNSGEATLEVAEIHPENNLRIKEPGLTARIEKTGLYEFNTDGEVIRVFEGKAEVDAQSKHVTVKSGHQLAAGDNGALLAKKFDRKSDQVGDDLYRWSRLRSSYLAEANINEAGYYAQYAWVPGGPLWWGTGWYGNPWFGAYTFLPAEGIFYSPFGWGFYSPWWVTRAPFYAYGYGYPHRDFYQHFSSTAAPRTWGPGPHYAMGRHYRNGVYRGPGAVSGGGFRASQGGGFHGAGFAHGGGGFHGGGPSIGGHLR